MKPRISFVRVSPTYGARWLCCGPNYHDLLYCGRTPLEAYLRWAIEQPVWRRWCIALRLRTTTMLALTNEQLRITFEDARAMAMTGPPGTVVEYQMPKKWWHL